MTLATGVAASIGASGARAHALALDAELLPQHEATQPLSKRLQTHDQTELLMLLDELGPSADADQSSRAVAALLQAGQPDVVADHALSALLRLKSREARPVLITFTRHRRPEARVLAYTALSSLRDARDVAVIAKGLQDSSPQVREQVAQLLGQLRATQVVADLLRALSLGVHPAAAAIGKLGDDASVQLYDQQLGRAPLAVMLEGYSQYLDRPDISESTKLGIVATLEDVAGAAVKAFLNERIASPGKHTTPKLLQAMTVSAGRIRVEPVQTTQPESQP